MDRYTLTPFASQFYDRTAIWPRRSVRMASRLISSMIRRPAGRSGSTRFRRNAPCRRRASPMTFGRSIAKHGRRFRTGRSLRRRSRLALSMTAQHHRRAGRHWPKRAGTTICFPDCGAKASRRSSGHYNLSTGLTYYQQEDEFNSALALTDGMEPSSNVTNTTTSDFRPSLPRDGAGFRSVIDWIQ